MSKDPSTEQLEKKLQEVERDEHPKREVPDSRAVRLIELFYAQNPKIFRDQFGVGHVQVPLAGSFEILVCESSRFEKYLRRLAWEEEIVLGSETLKQVKGLISGKAEFGADSFHLMTRVAALDDDFWYDLGGGRSVRTARGCWTVQSETPILFRNQSHQADQVLPLSGQGDIKRFLKHVRFKDPHHQCLFLVWLASCFVPDVPHPALVLFGEKGAAKSTTLRFARCLIDPSKLGLLSLPHPGELVQQLSHHYAAFYDNVGTISRSVSDSLCRAVTGEGSSKRKLYSDDEDVVYNFRRCIALNGINNQVEAADLLDRSILIELKRVPNEERIREEELNAAFDVDLPYILAGIFDALAEARRHIDKVKLEKLPRMADFALWGFTIAEALGYGGHFFLEAYDANIALQSDEAIEASPVALAIRCFMETRDEWEGSTAELLVELDPIAQGFKISLRDWPSRANVLSRRMNEVKSNLLDIGIVAEYIRESHNRGWHLSKRIVTTDITVINRLESSDDIDDDSFPYDAEVSSSIDQVRKRLYDDDDDNDDILRSPKARAFLNGQIPFNHLDEFEFSEAMVGIFGPGTEIEETPIDV